MKSLKKLQISSRLLFVYINKQNRKWRMSVLVFSSALALPMVGRGELSQLPLYHLYVYQRITRDH